MGTVVQRRLLGAAATTVSSAIGLSLANQHVNNQRPTPLDESKYASKSLSKAMGPLTGSGVAIVHDVLDEKILHKLRSTELYQSMPTELRRPAKKAAQRRGPPGARRGPGEDDQEQDLWPPSASGRYHRREDSFNDQDKQVFEELERKILPLVFDFFDAEAEDGKEDEEGFFRSEMQIFNAVPGSQSQSWHSDNQSRGITIIIPLVEFTPDNGPTQLLVGSHLDRNQIGFASYIRGILQQGVKVIQAPVGSIAAYDSRIYHRGLGNPSLEGRPAIIFCYDRMNTPPPGIGTYGSLRNSYWAGLLHILSPASWT